MTSDQVDLQTHLRSRMDQLVTSMLIQGPGAEVVSGLRQWRDAAGLANRPDLCEATASLLESVKDVKTPQQQQALQQGLSHLQAVLNNPAQAVHFPTSSPAASEPAAPVNLLAQDPELVGDFVTEAREHLSTIETHMLKLEKDPSGLESVHAVFRGFHTIKGLAGFLEFMPVRDVAHEVETLLDLARNAKMTISGGVVDTVLASVDYLKVEIDGLERSLTSGGVHESADNAALIERLQKIIRGDAVPQPLETANALATLADAIVNSENSSAPVDSATGASKESTGGASKNNPAASEAASVRVQTAKLDYLMDMVGEMVITQSLIRHNPALSAITSPKLLGDLSQLARITNEVQRTTMGMRMITIGSVFQRSSRLIRDLSRRAGKKIRLDISGEETELDKTIAEELTDPLLHMVRNSCDHGIEEPATRVAAGKDATARVHLAAYHQGGQIVVEISDDGRGLDREKIFAKAVQKGLIEPNAHLTEQEIFNLIFEPGFSTAAQITDLSGRGVGMDVVRRNIQKLRGRIEIQSRAGQGTTFLLKLPLTLAIIEGLVVGVGEHRYIVPIFAVRELISPKEGTLSTVHGRNETAMVRDRVLPVLRLAQRFNLKAPPREGQGLLIVTECQEQQFCLFVDEVLGKQEVVIKSLGETLKNVIGIAGGAILGDGRVGLILDLDGVFRG